MDVSFAVSLALCFLVGILLSLFGGGGGVLAVPIFVYVAHLSAQEAISTSLLVTGAASAIAAIGYIQRKAVNWRLAIIFLISGSGSAWLGAHATSLLSGQTLMTMFGVLMMLISGILFFKANKSIDEPGVVVCRPGILISGAVGVAVGFLTGFLGVGGGFLIVPAIAVLMRCSLQTAIGTALVIIAVNSLNGFLSHVVISPVSWELSGLFLFFSIAGVFFGGILSSRIKTASLQKGFSILIFLVGFFLMMSRWLIA